MASSPDQQDKTNSNIRKVYTEYFDIEDKMSEPLRPQFFITRQNGNIIPLIALDELPHHIRVEDVPRSMTIKETVGMTNVGEFPSRHRQYNIIDTNRSTQKLLSTQAYDIKSFRSDQDSSSSNSTALHVDLAPGPQKSFGIDEQPPAVYQMTRQEPLTSVSNSKVAEAFGKIEHLPSWKDTAKLGARSLVPGKKIFCTHWMSTGECDYAQQGCLYKHEMPFDLEVLNFLGYQDIPKWYREKHGIGKLTAAPGSGAAILGPTMQSTASQATSAWKGYASGNERSSVPTLLALPRRKEIKEKPRLNTKIYSRQTRQQTPGTILRLPTERPSHLPNRPPHPILKNTSIIGNSSLYESKYATHDARPIPPPPSPATSTQETALAQSQYYEAISRRSSLYSDAETQFIREADERREREEREYEVIKRNIEIAKLGSNSDGSGSGASV